MKGFSNEIYDNNRINFLFSDLFKKNAKQYLIFIMQLEFGEVNTARKKIIL